MEFQPESLVAVNRKATDEDRTDRRHNPDLSETEITKLAEIRPGDAKFYQLGDYETKLTPTLKKWRNELIADGVLTNNGM